MAQTLSDIKALLAAHGLHPKHRYGQNFLHDGNHLNRILDAAALTPGDLVLEVGPGTGALTERLLNAGAYVVAVEIDRDLEPLLRQRLSDQCPTHAERFKLLIDDVLAGKHELNPRVLDALAQAKQNANRSSGYKLIANLPYNVASPLLINLAKHDAAGTGPMTHAVVMLQKEVAQRIAAKPGGKDYGPLGILLQALYEPQLVGTLSAGCFWPAPKVASAVLALVRRTTPLTDDFDRLAEFTHRLFQSRRKQLRAMLGGDFDYPSEITPQQRPETLSVEQIIHLAACESPANRAS